MLNSSFVGVLSPVCVHWKEITLASMSRGHQCASVDTDEHLCSLEVLMNHVVQTETSAGEREG